MDLAYDPVLRSNASLLPPPSLTYAELLHKLLSSIPEYRASLDINEYGLLTVTIVGCVANLLALCVLVNLCHIPMYNYMTALAVVDSSVLLGPCLSRWLQTQDVNITAHSTAVCRILFFQHFWSLAMSAWILVAMTLDRFVAISFPLRAKILSTPMRARVILLIIAVILLSVNSHFFFTMEVREEQKACVGYDEYGHFLQSVWPWIDATIYSFAPFSFLLVFNIIIIVKHRQYLRVNVMLTGHGPTRQQGSFKPNRRLTILLFTVTFSFMLLTAPKALLHIIRHDVFDFKSNGKMDFKVFAQYTLTTSIVGILMYTNHSINFFLYCLTGKKFRQQLVQMFSQIYIKIKRTTTISKIAPSEMSTRGIVLKNNNSMTPRNENNDSVTTETNVGGIV